jgi:hypothetical protein
MAPPDLPTGEEKELIPDFSGEFNVFVFIVILLFVPVGKLSNIYLMFFLPSFGGAGGGL